MNDHGHTHKAFDAELDHLHRLVMTMGGLVEQAAGEAAAALDRRDNERAAAVVESDRKVDALEEDINTEVVRLLALRQPRASDLRMVISVMKIAGNLERLGDYAKNLAKRVPVLTQAEQVPGATASVRRLSKSVRVMLNDALDAYGRGDADLAADVRARDVEIDEMTNALFREFLTHMMEDPRNITPCMHLLFIAKNLERMGDHVTAIAEQVIYLTTGDLPDPERPKGASTSGLQAPDSDEG